MRIHTSLTESDIRTIVQNGARGVTLESLTIHGSRKRARGIEVKLWGTSPRQNMSRTGNAATWDEWGDFIARVFEADPGAIVGQYRDVHEFEGVTQWRFDSEFTPTPGHAHKWNYVAPFTFQCKCDAKMSMEPLRVSS